MSEEASTSTPNGPPESPADVGHGWPAAARVTALVLALSLTATLVVVALLLRDDDPAPQANDASASALLDASTGAQKAARDAVVRMTTYDYRTIEKDFGWVDDAGTDAFQTYFTKSRRDVTPVIRHDRVIAKGAVIQSAAKAIDADHATVLLFVDQIIRVAGQRGTKIDQPRVTLDMVRQDGRWLVDKVHLNGLKGSS